MHLQDSQLWDYERPRSKLCFCDGHNGELCKLAKLSLEAVKTELVLKVDITHSLSQAHNMLENNSTPPNHITPSANAMTSVSSKSDAAEQVAMSNAQATVLESKADASESTAATSASTVAVVVTEAAKGSQALDVLGTAETRSASSDGVVDKSDSVALGLEHAQACGSSEDMQHHNLETAIVLTAKSNVDAVAGVTVQSADVKSADAGRGELNGANSASDVYLVESDTKTALSNATSRVVVANADAKAADSEDRAKVVISAGEYHAAQAANAVNAERYTGADVSKIDAVVATTTVAVAELSKDAAEDAKVNAVEDVAAAAEASSLADANAAATTSPSATQTACDAASVTQTTAAKSALMDAPDSAALEDESSRKQSNMVGSAELSEGFLGDDEEKLVSSGSAVQILNKIIEVVEDEEASSSEDVKIVMSASEEAAAKAAQEEEDAKARVAEEAGEQVAPKEDLTITDPLPVAKQDDEDSADEEEYPELSAQELERYNKMMLKEGDACPACGKGTLILRQNEKVAFLGCSCYPQCKLRYYTSRSNAVITLKTLESTCPECGSQLEVKKGRYGLFIGCSDYPQCTYVYRDEAVHDEVECPVCKKGTLERRRARSGRIFFGCNHYPECDFIVPGIPVQSPCKDCGFPIRYKKKVKAGIALVCANPECGSRRRRKQEIIAS